MRWEMMGDEGRYRFAMSRLPKKSTAVSIGANCSIGFKVEIDEGTEIHDNVVIRGKVVIGKNCLIKSGSVIGDKGFSYGFDENGVPVHIHHTGGVVIGDNVEIGSLCTVCRGTLENTVLGNNVKLDDHIHIAHNVTVGESTCISAGVITGGGTVIGKHCWLGMNSTIKNKAKVADYTLVGVGAVVIKDTEPESVVAGNPARELRKRNHD